MYSHFLTEVLVQRVRCSSAYRNGNKIKILWKAAHRKICQISNFVFNRQTHLKRDNDGIY